MFCSSATDPYTPAERKWKLTRGCLEVMARRPPAFLTLQTRSPLVQRDADLLARIPTALVSITVTTDDERVRRLLEPNAPGIALRIDALAALRAAGVPTQAAVSPLLPCDAERLARRARPGRRSRRRGRLLPRRRRGRSPRAAALESAARGGLWRVGRAGLPPTPHPIFRRIFGPARVVESQGGFNDTSWLDHDR